MILQKLAQAIRRQDWFQVTIEVLIVIVGIFLGLQVQNWYEAQTDRELEKVYLQRLIDDADASIVALARNIETGNIRIESIERTYQLMLNHQVTEDNRKEFSTYFEASKGFSAMDVYLTTIDELVASGQVTLIQSKEIREAIGLFRKEYEVSNRAQERGAASLERIYVDINDLIKLDGMGETIQNSLEGLNGDGMILRKFRMIKEMHNRVHFYNNRIANYTKEYKDKILNELEKVQ